MKLFIISGEASGDLHGANLIHELKKINPDTEIHAWGGDLMEKEGAKITKHYEELAFMGFAEVILNIRTIQANFKKCREDITSFSPDAVLMIDYPGFNLRIAPFVKKLGIPVIYYISPQIWAWKQNRIHQIKRLVDKMLVILPFEKDFYKKFDMEVEFVGHPLIDAIEKDRTRSQIQSTPKKKALALLPGSRKQEISRMLPVMIESAKNFPEYPFIIAGAPGISDSFYHHVLNTTEIKINRTGTYDVLTNANIALVTSGTATLECALLKIPQVVCYKGNILSYWIAKKLVKVKYISLVNLIMDEQIVKELIQNECSSLMMVKELKQLLFKENRTVQIANFDKLELKLGGKGASKKAASAVFKTLEESINR